MDAKQAAGESDESAPAPGQMLTLQILDGGATFFHPLDGPAVIGRSEDANIRLTETGIEPEHARIEPIAGSDDFKIVDLGGDVGTRVNGDLVAQRRLALGDRIEIGAAVLVVGQRVRRPATPDDVLESPAIGSGTAELRRSRRRGPDPAAARRRKVVWIAGTVAVVLGVLAVVLWTEGRDTKPRRWKDVTVLRRQAKVDEARRLITGFREDWAAGNPERLAAVGVLEAEVDAFDDALRAGRVRIREEARTRTRPQQLKALKAERERDPNGLEGEVATILLSELAELRLGIATRSGVRDDPADAVADGPKPGATDVTPSDPGADEQPDPALDPVADVLVRDQLKAIEQLRESGDYALALELVTQTLPNIPEAQAGPLRDVHRELSSEISARMRDIVRTVRDQVATGRVEDVDAALARLRAEAKRLPSGGQFTALVQEERDLEEYRVRLTTRPAAIEAEPAPERLSDLRDDLAAARRADREGDFATAARLFGTLAERMRERDPLYARSLDGRRIDLELCADLKAFVAGHAGDLALTDRDGTPLPLEVDASGTLASFAWSELGSKSLREQLVDAKAPPRVLLGGAVLIYRAGDIEAAESVLARAARAESDLRELVSGVIARGRGETADRLGYELVKGRFVAVRAIQAEKRGKEIKRELGRVAKSPLAQREAWLEDVLARGPQELDGLIVGLKTQLDESTTRLEKDPFKKHYDAMGALRVELDRSRSFAKELIYDEETYFYPYKPPAVSGERASEYWKVQKEVDIRVAAVRGLWQQDVKQKKVPSKFSAQLDQIEWMIGVLTSFGEYVPGLQDRLEWVRSLPQDEPLGLRNFCEDAKERSAREFHARITAYNAKVFEELPRAESAQVQITNAYRMMFGHRPLAVNRKIVSAARGHAEEMGRLGYFSHFSPVPGRRTPHDRMRLAEYSSGISENIAKSGSAATAHNAWIRSSGHHRNLLHPRHTEFAVGNDGSLWVQNFGRGEEFEEEDDF